MRRGDARDGYLERCVRTQGCSPLSSSHGFPTLALRMLDCLLKKDGLRRCEVGGVDSYRLGREPT
jgi:hypothetical protein